MDKDMFTSPSNFNYTYVTAIQPHLTFRMDSKLPSAEDILVGVDPKLERRSKCQAEDFEIFIASLRTFLIMESTSIGLGMPGSFQNHGSAPVLVQQHSH